MTFNATRAGSGTQTQGWGWTWCARSLAVGTLAVATLTSGLTASSRAVAAVTPENVIVRGSAGCTASVLTSIANLGGRVTHSLGILNGASAVIGSDRLSALRASSCVASVTPDGTVALSSIGGYDPTAAVGSLYNTTQMVGAQSYWQAGYTGKGVDVALIDSGVSPVQGLAANGQVVNGPDISFDSQSPTLVSLDGYGHGTHLASIIAGRDPAATTSLLGAPGVAPAAAAPGAASTPVKKHGKAKKRDQNNGSGSPVSSNGYAGNTSQFLGVAPDANIVSVKVADAHGASDVSQVIAGLDWTVQHAHDAGRNIRVINLSFGTDGVQSYELDPLAYAAEQAWQQGIVVVVAAGNGGEASTSLANPAIDPFVIAVGAADTNATTTPADDTVASFSNTGSDSRSPDLVAPGVHIEGLRVPGSSIDQQFGSAATVASRFFLGSGTSQATAVVSGAAALVLQQRPDASPDEVKALLTMTATPLAGQPASRQGAGELNLTPALTVDKVKGKQKFATSDGSGTLEASRGTLHLVNNGVTLSGEQDVFGGSWDSASMAAGAANQSAWNGGTFNGGGWSGGGWSGGGWSNAGWTSNMWSGGGWSGGGWSSNVWTGGGWSGGGWSGGGWSGGGWSGGGWSGGGWSGGGWADSLWG